MQEMKRIEINKVIKKNQEKLNNKMYVCESTENAFFMLENGKKKSTGLREKGRKRLIYLYICVDIKYM